MLHWLEMVEEQHASTLHQIHPQSPEDTGSSAADFHGENSCIIRRVNNMRCCLQSDARRDSAGAGEGGGK